MALVLQTAATVAAFASGREREFIHVWHACGALSAGMADVQVHLASLSPGDAAGLAECWSGSAPVTQIRHGEALCRQDGELMFISVGVAADDIVAATQRAYGALFAAMQVEAYPHLVRCWNYVPAINAGQADPVSGVLTERYRLFNQARQDAFRVARQSFEVGAPAACALGSHEGPYTLYAIAARRAPVCIENPRQLSAYYYPAQYGARSPSFSRAALLDLADGSCVLFVSGTAAIVGHQSLHPGDVVAQTEESLRNIRAVVSQAGGRFAMERLQYKAFVRHGADAAMVAEVMHRELGTQAHIAFLQADVCRAELLVEIEACGMALA